MLLVISQSTPKITDHYKSRTKGELYQTELPVVWARSMFDAVRVWRNFDSFRMLLCITSGGSAFDKNYSRPRPWHYFSVATATSANFSQPYFTYLEQCIPEARDNCEFDESNGLLKGLCHDPRMRAQLEKIGQFFQVSTGWSPSLSILAIAASILL